MILRKRFNPPALRQRQRGFIFNLFRFSSGDEALNNTRRWATLNSEDRDATVINEISADKLNFKSNAGTGCTRATLGKMRGKWYWEVRANKLNPPCVGIAHISASLTNWPGYTSSWVWYGHLAKFSSSNAGGDKFDYGALWNNIGDVIGLALDADAGTLTLYKNGVSMGVAVSGLSTEVIYPYFGVQGWSADADVNFGQKPWAYAPPEGFSGIYLDEIVDGRQYAMLDPVMSTVGAMIRGNHAGYLGFSRTKFGLKTGKWYWECHTGALATWAMLGVVPEGSDETGVTTRGWGVAPNGVKYSRTGNNGTYTSSFAAGDTIGVALDIDAGTIRYFKNGADLGIAFSGLPANKALYPAVGTWTEGTHFINLNFGQEPFRYTPPAGFNAGFFRPKSEDNETPALGYATWDPVKKAYFNALSNGNLLASGDINNGARSTVGVSAGKWYWEIKSDGQRFPTTGVCLSHAAIRGYPGQESDYQVSWGIYLADGTLRFRGGIPSYPGASAFTASDVLGVALNLDERTLTFYKNGVSMGVAFTDLPAGTYHAMMAGDTATLTANASANFGASPMAYPLIGHNQGLYAPIDYVPGEPAAMPADPYAASVVFDMLANGAAGSNVFVDTSAQAIALTASGNTVHSTNSWSYGGSSAYFDGSGDYLSCAATPALNLGSGQSWTIEVLAMCSNLANAPHLVQIGNSLNNRITLYAASGNMRVYTNSGGAPADWIISDEPDYNGSWHHYGATYDGATLRLYRDRALVGTAAVPSARIPNVDGQICIGWQIFGGLSSDYLKGSVQRVRVTKGVAREPASMFASLSAAPTSSLA